MSAFGQAGFGSRNRRTQLRAQGQMEPFGNQVRQAMQAPTLNIYTQPAAATQASAGMSAYAPQPAASGSTTPATTTAVTGGMGRTSPGTAQPIQPQSQGEQYSGYSQPAQGQDPTYQSRVDAAAQQWNSTPAGSQQRDWIGNTTSRMSPEMAEQWMRANATGGGGAPMTQPDPSVQREYVMTGWGVGTDGQTMRPTYGPGGLGQVQLPRYTMAADGSMQPAGSTATGQLSETGIRSTSLPTVGMAQPIQPQSQGTPYGSLDLAEIEREAEWRWFAGQLPSVQERLNANPREREEKWQKQWSLTGPGLVNEKQQALDEMRFNEQQWRDFNAHNEMRVSDPSLPTMDTPRYISFQQTGTPYAGSIRNFEGERDENGLIEGPLASDVAYRRGPEYYDEWARSMMPLWRQNDENQALMRAGRQQLGMQAPQVDLGDKDVGDWQSQKAAAEAAYRAAVQEELARRGTPWQWQAPGDSQYTWQSMMQRYT